jgi:serine protease
MRAVKTAIATALCCALSFSLSAKPELDATNNRYLVTFKPGSKAALLNAVKAERGVMHHALDKHHTIAVELNANAIAKLKLRRDVVRVEQDPKRYLTAESQPYGIAMVQAPLVSDAATGNTKVCIVDTGYSLGHEDLPSTNITGSDGYSRYDTGNWFEDGHGHGTHVAGTIAALGNNDLGVIGVNPSGQLPLHIVKVFNDRGRWAYGSDLVVAVEQCTSAGAKVISMSLGGGGSSSVEQAAFDDAFASGVIAVAAAGNDGNSGLSFPASYDSVISVAAVDSNGAWASFSQFNAQVEIAAPGVAVLSTLPNNSYASWSGTSMATPHVSGVLALVWSQYPDCSNGDMRAAMALSALDKGASGRDTQYGHGIIQAKAMSDLFANGCDVGAPPPPPEPESLANGVAEGPINGGAGDELHYKMVVPADATNLSFSISGGTGDADLYVKFGDKPTTTNYDCRPYLNGNNESCDFSVPNQGDYYVMVRGYTAFSGVSLLGQFEQATPNVPPVSAFTYSCTDRDCEFNGTSSSDADGSLVAYNWNFGDGVTATGSSASHAYLSDGEFVVSLTVVDNRSAADTSSQTLNVLDTTPNVLPSAAFNYNCSYLSCEFSGSPSSDSDGAIVSYNWQFGDGSSANGENVSHTFSASGSFTVTLTVTDNQAGEGSTNQTISVTAPPAAPISLSVTGSKVKKTNYVDLTWQSATGSMVEVYRMRSKGGAMFTVPNSGSYSDVFDGGGSTSYKVCELGGTVCSDTVTLVY